ncbi:ThiJ/PfpI [Panaeolus papilionaceus]|nr:ThiJ/PfpI [Panaeolus papilionaceus]
MLPHNVLKLVFVFTTANVTLSGKNTGWYLPEAARPYYVLEPHVQITFASLTGPNPPVDLSSVTAYPDDNTNFLNNQKVKNLFANAKKLSDIKAKDFDGIFYVGGLGPVLDLAPSPLNAKKVSEFWQAGKVVSAICHGPSAFVGAVDANGVHIIKGRRFAGLTDAEEEADGKTKEIPFSLEQRLTYHGGTMEKAGIWLEKVVVDGRLVTGQNPASGDKLGKEILKALRKYK